MEFISENKISKENINLLDEEMNLKFAKSIEKYIYTKEFNCLIKLALNAGPCYQKT